MKKLLIILIICTGCAMNPKYERPEIALPQDYGVQAQSGVEKLQINSPELSRLINAAFKYNHDMLIAVKRIEEAQKMHGIAKSELLPSISADGSYTATQVMRAGSDVNESYSAGGTMSYELDFFGRVRSLSKKALADYFATKYAATSYQIALAAQVAELYVSVNALSEQINVTNRVIETNGRSLELIQHKYRAGLATEVDVQSATMLLNSSISALHGLARECSAAKSALTLLTGENIQMENIDISPIPNLTAGLPAELITHRPDIMQAEQILIGANADIGAARAAFFPRITLTGSAGYTSESLSGLFTGDSGVWSFMPQISIPIFNRGRLRAELSVAKIRKEIAVIEYEKTVKTAFTEVFNALNATDYYAKQISAQEEVVKAGDIRLKYAKLRYNAGISSGTELLDAERAGFESEMALIALRHDQQVNAIALYKALGGFYIE